MKIAAALEQALAGRRERAAAVAAGGIAHPEIVLPVPLVDAAAPPGYGR